MALFGGIKRQLRSVIEWQNPESGVLFYEWSNNGDEIKNASKLLVGPGQGCIFVYEGKVQAVLEQECLVDLQTANEPFITTLKKYMQFFESEHKVGIYFFKRTTILDQKWGTRSAIKYEDPKYKFPVGLKAFGNYSYKIREAQSFFVGVVGSHNHFTVEDFREVMSSRITQPLADYLAEGRFSYAEIDAKREEIAQGMAAKLTEVFSNLGFEITDFRIEGTDFDDDTLKRINQIADLSAEAQAAQAAGLDYAKLQQLEAMREAARNTGGGAGMGMGLGAGMSFGQTLAQTMNATQPPKVEVESNDIMQKLQKLKQMREAELISEEEYTAKKKTLLEHL